MWGVCFGDGGVSVCFCEGLGMSDVYVNLCGYVCVLVYVCICMGSCLCLCDVFVRI